MLEKFLSILLHAKSGALATLLVLGTSGALVAAAVDNGMTTVVTTQSEETSTASSTSDKKNPKTNGPVEEAILALFNRTSAEDDPTSTATGKGCSDEAHERNKWMKEVNDTLKESHQAVLGLSKDAPKSADTRALVKDADTELKDLRQEAVKLIHGTFDCDPNEDEDTTSTTSTSDTTTTDTTGTITGDTAEEIAASAIALMEEVVAKLEEALNPEDAESDEATTTSTNTNGKSDSNKPENKGKGNGKGRSR